MATSSHGMYRCASAWLTATTAMTSRPRPISRCAGCRPPGWRTAGAGLAGVLRLRARAGRQVGEQLVQVGLGGGAHRAVEPVVERSLVEPPLPVVPGQPVGRRGPVGVGYPHLGLALGGWHSRITS